jgi:hypothetical protein
VFGCMGRWVQGERRVLCLHCSGRE